MGVLLVLITLAAIALAGFGIFTMVGLGFAGGREEKRLAKVAAKGPSLADGVFTGAENVTWTEMSGAWIRLADMLTFASERGYELTTSVPSGKYYTNHTFTKVNP